MFLRFVTTRIHAGSHKQEGVFAASSALLDSDDLTRHELQHLRDLLDWFDATLPEPPKTFKAKRATLFPYTTLFR